MKILIIGGTIFVGRHLAQTALERGHEITLFNRGQHSPDLFPEVKKLRGDRDGGLDILLGNSWDAVIDTCGYVPRVVGASARLLSSLVDHYTFVSSISAYGDVSRPGVDEEYPAAELVDTSVEEINEKTYGPLKALCEHEVGAEFPEKSLIVRPGIIVGPHDPTDRFTYWPVRAARGGEILAPNPPNAPVQFIDVRDLAEWMVEKIENRATGVYNATGPDYLLDMSQFLKTCIAVAGAGAQLTWVSKEFLADSKVEEWSDLPLWLSDEENAGLLATNVQKAISAGLSFRSLAQTIKDTISWANSRDSAHEWRAGLDSERENRLLFAWHDQSAG
ncbi:MAG: SDR family oxidoreductase [Candidatus Promineifilaceae bacterium]